MRLLFSQRYHRAMEQAAIAVDIPDAARRKVWAWLSANNTSLGVRRDPSFILHARCNARRGPNISDLRTDSLKALTHVIKYRLLRFGIADR